jgi:hypothetical protein
VDVDLDGYDIDKVGLFDDHSCQSQHVSENLARDLTLLVSEGIFGMRVTGG